MTVFALNYYRLKSEFLPQDTKSAGVYVRPGELGIYFEEPSQWELVRIALHSTVRLATDIELKGFSLRIKKKYTKSLRPFYKTHH
jgi:hypothetical protein